MRLGWAYVTTMCGGDKDRATRVSSLANEEPLVVVKARVDVMREVVREDRSDSCGGVIREGKASLCRGGRGSVRERADGTENGNVSHTRGSGIHRGSEVFASWRGDEDIVGVDSDILVERSKEEGIEYFLGYTGRRGRHD